MRKRIPQLWDPDFLEREARRHESMTSIAQSIGCGPGSVRRAYERFNITPPVSKMTSANVHNGRVGARRRTADERAHILRNQKENHKRYRRGCLRQERIRSVARFLQRGMACADIAQHLALPLQSIRQLTASPLVRALHYAWGDLKLEPGEVKALAREMVFAGFDAHIILKVLEVNVAPLARKYEIEL